MNSEAAVCRTEHASQRLTTIEKRLLEALMAHPGTPICRKKIMLDVWGIGPDSFSRTLDVHVGRLRRKTNFRIVSVLDKGFHGIMILTAVVQ